MDEGGVVRVEEGGVVRVDFVAGHAEELELELGTEPVPEVRFNAKLTPKLNSSTADPPDAEADDRPLPMPKAFATAALLGVSVPLPVEPFPPFACPLRPDAAEETRLFAPTDKLDPTPIANAEEAGTDEEEEGENGAPSVNAGLELVLKDEIPELEFEPVLGELYVYA